MDHQAFAQMLGNYGEFVGAIAVVATLAYLAIQVRISGKNTAMDARQRVLDRFSDAKSHILDEQMYELLVSGTGDYEGMTAVDRGRFSILFSIFADNLYNAIQLREEGVLDEEAFEYIANAFVGTCATPGGRSWWARSRSGANAAPPKLRVLVDDRLERFGEAPSWQVVYTGAVADEPGP